MCVTKASRSICCLDIKKIRLPREFYLQSRFQTFAVNLQLSLAMFSLVGFHVTKIQLTILFQSPLFPMKKLFRLTVISAAWLKLLITRFCSARYFIDCESALDPRSNLAFYVSRVCFFAKLNVSFFASTQIWIERIALSGVKRYFDLKFFIFNYLMHFLAQQDGGSLKANNVSTFQQNKHKQKNFDQRCWGIRQAKFIYDKFHSATPGQHNGNV